MLRSQRHVGRCRPSSFWLTFVSLILASVIVWLVSSQFLSLHRHPTPSICRVGTNASEPQRPAWIATYEDFRDLRCALLSTGDAVEQETVRAFKTNHSAPFACYRDAYIGCTTCHELLAGIQPSSDATAEERDFPLAYGLRVHTCATQVELLLRAIYEPHNFYCIHVDAKASPSFISAMRRFAQCLPNVHLAALDEDFVYASSSQMEADLECMQAASQSSVKWRYFINLAGQELPLKTNYELVQLLRSLNGSSHVYINPPAFPERQTHSFWCKESITNKTVPCPQPRQRKTLPPRNMTIYKSNAYGEFSRAFVEYLLKRDGFARQLYDWFSDTFAPEEHYFASLLALQDTPGGVWNRTLTRAVVWRGFGPCNGRFVRLVCIFVSADLPYLWGRAEPFVNKLHFEDDPIAVRCLVESVGLRARLSRVRRDDASSWQSLTANAQPGVAL